MLRISCDALSPDTDTTRGADTHEKCIIKCTTSEGCLVIPIKSSAFSSTQDNFIRLKLNSNLQRDAARYFT